MYSDNLCRICKLFPESQSHLLQCPDIIPKLKLLSNYKEIDENYIYGDVSKQLKIVKIYTKVLEIREELLEDLEVLQSGNRLANAFEPTPFVASCAAITVT